MFGSSYKVVRTSSDSSNTFVQSFTALLTFVIDVVIMLAHFYLISGKVEGYAFNYNLAI